MPLLENLRIYAPPDDKQDALGLWHDVPMHFIVRNTVIDLSAQALNTLDEAVSITWGSSAEFENCLFRGAGKLVLLGSGDVDKRHLEEGKTVTFRSCIFEKCGRRAPEVQCGMVAHMENCLIKDWGVCDRFDVRAFAGWAHDGGKLYADHCIFQQESTSRGLWYGVVDLMNHIGQAVNDDGLSALSKLSTYTNGRKRALMGNVEATNCYWYPDDLVVENAASDLSEDDGLILALELQKIHDWLLNGTPGERTIKCLAGEDSAVVEGWCERNGLVLDWM